MGRIKVAKFLYNRRLLGVRPTQCRRRAGEETLRHIALFCTDEAVRLQCLRTNG
jgi:hypothetical protein